MSNALLDRLKLENPIFLAPLAGGPSTPELAAAVSNAGGLGALGLEYLSIQQINDSFRRVRELSRKPINANLFAPVTPQKQDGDPARMLSLMSDIHRELGLEPPGAGNSAGIGLQEKVDAVIAAKPEVFSFTFGVMPDEVMRRVKAEHMFVIGTATTMEEAIALEQAGVDAIVAQGAEAGGHRGTFAGPFETSMIPTFDLVQQIVQRSRLPVIASGGLMDGNDISRALAAGASAVQLGTAFLACPEAGTSEPYRRALLEARPDTTMITRAFSGRPARGLRNRFASMLEKEEKCILPFPVQNALTRPMRKASAEQGKPDYLSLWAGTGVAKIRAMPAAEVVRQLVAEMSGR